MTQVTLQQLREFGITPDTSLGQHFLIDDNILRVIDELAALTSDDVVYEPGPGVGVLTRYLADRVAAVHAVELDERLRPALEALVGGCNNVHLHWGDALRVQAQVLDPLPGKLVSNLPYHVSGPIVGETLQHAPTVRRYCVMVQREVADRFFAPVGSSGYGSLSVVIQALCTKVGTHKVSRRVFLPVPNVDSTLVGFARDRQPVDDGDVPSLAAFVRRSFAHRRKTLANNLGSAGVPREQTVAALAGVGLGASARPQEVAPDQFVALYRELGGAAE